MTIREVFWTDLLAKLGDPIRTLGGLSNRLLSTRHAEVWRSRQPSGWPATTEDRYTVMELTLILSSNQTQVIKWISP